MEISVEKNANFSCPVFKAPVEGLTVGILYSRLGCKKKLKWWPYQMLENVRRYVDSFRHSIPQQEGRTNGQIYTEMQYQDSIVYMPAHPWQMTTKNGDRKNVICKG